jgi:hypothetical protein
MVAVRVTHHTENYSMLFSERDYSSVTSYCKWLFNVSKCYIHTDVGLQMKMQQNQTFQDIMCFISHQQPRCRS